MQANERRNVKRKALHVEGKNKGMVDEGDFQRMKQEMTKYDAEREVVIKRSRDIQKLSKQAIFSLHRKDVVKASKQIEDALAAAKEIEPVVQANPTLRGGSFSSALEEYAEAVIFRHYLSHGELISSQEENVNMCNIDEYLGGVLDFTGELNRFAIARATLRDLEEVERCRDLVETLMGVFLQFDLRNGSLRKKYDALKYTLKKLENTLYELSLTNAGLVTKPEEIEVPEVKMDNGAED
eukprot:scaffold541_cov335-Pavlova_lutheri.AAC.4